MDILVSVIVPVYNVAPFLRKCIDYIIVQSFADFELFSTCSDTPATVAVSSSTTAA